MSPLCVAAALAALIAAAFIAGKRERFFTSEARESPTRSWVPYTGSVALGGWGAAPWAEWAGCPGPECTRGAPVDPW